MPNRNLVLQALAEGEGIVRLAPCWVPRSFLMPGGRLKLDPRDLYALGAHRGGIDERWFSSTTKAANGPLTAPDEGLSYIEFNGRKAFGTSSANSSTTSDRSRIICIKATSSPRGSGRRASPRPIIFRRSITSR